MKKRCQIIIESGWLKSNEHETEEKIITSGLWYILDVHHHRWRDSVQNLMSLLYITYHNMCLYVKFSSFVVD